MAGANTRVVRRSAALSELMQEPYGVNFVYHEHAYHSSRLRAIKVFWHGYDRSYAFFSIT